MSRHVGKKTLISNIQVSVMSLCGRDIVGQCRRDTLLLTRFAASLSFFIPATVYHMVLRTDSCSLLLYAMFFLPAVSQPDLCLL